jgi:S-adenosylhomocysteine hydrolase
MSDSPTNATWSVTSQVPQTQIAATGAVQDGYLVSFVTGEGHPGQVFVPMGQYQAAKVRELIQAQANTIDQVGALTHDSQV